MEERTISNWIRLELCIDSFCLIFAVKIFVKIKQIEDNTLEAMQLGAWKNVEIPHVLCATIVSGALRQRPLQRQWKRGRRGRTRMFNGLAAMLFSPLYCLKGTKRSARFAGSINPQKTGIHTRAYGVRYASHFSPLTSHFFFSVVRYSTRSASSCSFMAM